MSDKKVAIYPGTFNPFTVYHYNILQKGLKLFDEVVVVIEATYGQSRDHILTMDQMDKLKKIPGVKVFKYDSLIPDVAQSLNAQYIIKGVRNITDFEKEKKEIRLNTELGSDIETILIVPDKEFENIYSDDVLKMKKYGKDISRFIL